MAVQRSPERGWSPGGTRCGGVENATSPQCRISAMDPELTLCGMPYDSCCGGGPYRAARHRSEVLGLVGHTFQWCLSQSATISSPLGIVRTRTTAGRLSDPNFGILDSPCEHRTSSLSACPRFCNPHGQP